jgi:alkylation response protein AidB-like acyl-CoA dehydrogenase
MKVKILPLVQWQIYASEIALEVANEAVQIHGGNGYVAEYHVERMMRDSKITQIYEELQIQRIVISRGLVSNSNKDLKTLFNFDWKGFSAIRILRF